MRIAPSSERSRVQGEEDNPGISGPAVKKLPVPPVSAIESKSEIATLPKLLDHPVLPRSSHEETGSSNMVSGASTLSDTNR